MATLPSEAATRELFAAYWRSRSIADRNAIVAAWEPLIWILMGKHNRTWSDAEDPYSHAAEGLIRAVESYSGQTKFSTWAGWKIRWRLRDGARAIYGRGVSPRIQLRPLSQIEHGVVSIPDSERVPEYVDTELRLLLQKLAGERAGLFLWLWLIKGELHKTIGEQHGLSESRVSSICTRGVQYIREQRQRAAAAFGLETV